MTDESPEIAMKDVFVSHSWGDKEFVEPLVVALQGAGITCWYDILELSPGDSLIDGINQGLTHCKIVLFCLSENFLKGNWTSQELNAAFALSRLQERSLTRIVPLMMTNPDIMIKAYPVQFGGRLYIQLSEMDADQIVNELKKVLAEIDAVGKDYWYRDAHSAYATGDFAKAALSACKAVDSDPKYFPALVLYIASVLRMDRPMDAFRFVFQKKDEWWAGIDEFDVDIDILDYVQDTLTDVLTGDEIKETGFTFAMLHFLGRDANANRAWRYIIRLFDKDKFRFHQDRILIYSVLNGKEDTIEWLRKVPFTSRKEDVKKTLANALYILAAKVPHRCDEVVQMGKALVADHFEDVRVEALPVCYAFAKDGEEIVFRALRDRAPMVRLMAFTLLAGVHTIEVGDDWMPKERDSTEPATPAACFNPEIVEEMLNDPDELVFDAVVDMIREGRVVCPIGVDITLIQRPSSDKARKVEVKSLVKEGTDAAHDKLMQIALDDPGEFVRSEAIEALEENVRPLPAVYLRQLWEAETVSRVKKDLDSLILEKGDASIPDVYVDILERNLDSSYTSEKAFLQLARSGDTELIKQGLNVCLMAERNEIAASGLSELVEVRLLEEASAIVHWCFEHGKEERNAILAVGQIPTIPIGTLGRYHDHKNPILRADSLRAQEQRLRDGSGLCALRELYQVLKLDVLEKDSNALWASIEAIDGIIEFGDSAEAVELLKEYYSTVDALFKDGSFPLRAAWERLRILGVNIPHPVYDPADALYPYPWPSVDGPYYGIGVGKSFAIHPDGDFIALD